MATQAIIVPSGPAPIGYLAGGASDQTPLAAAVNWDGTGAAGDFLPCLSVYSSDGQLIARHFPDSKMTTGDVAEVTYHPFRKSSGGAIRFNVDNVGTFLSIRTTGFDTGGHSVWFRGPIFQIASTAFLVTSSGGTTINGGAVVIAPGGGKKIEILTSGAADITLQTERFVIVGLPLTGKLEVRDHSGNPIFRVNEDGSLQGKTGKTLTFNL